ncbi:MAG: 3'-5' exonuclease [Bacteroidetes bacterium]|nr:3'-5' exonuclease [Bacteroidota bacterium]
MGLNLVRPLVTFDLETTGIDVVKDRIVEISIIKVFADGKKDVKTRRVNPLMPIPAGSSAIHGIFDEDVVDCPPFKSIAKSLAVYITGCDIAGFNSNMFDIPMLMEEFLRAGVDIDLKKVNAIDVQNIFHKMEQRTLVAAYKFYCQKDLTDAHSAEADAMATFEVLEAQIERYSDVLNGEVKDLSEFSERKKFADYAGRVLFNEEGEEVFGFGKHKGVSVESVFKREPGYYTWIMNGDFPEYTKKILTNIRLRTK